MAQDNNDWLERLARDLVTQEIKPPSEKDIFDNLEYLDEGLYFTDTGICQVSRILH